jgi:hypothetical protein
LEYVQIAIHDGEAVGDMSAPAGKVNAYARYVHERIATMSEVGADIPASLNKALENGLEVSLQGSVYGF